MTKNTAQKLRDYMEDQDEEREIPDGRPRNNTFRRSGTKKSVHGQNDMGMQYLKTDQDAASGEWGSNQVYASNI